MPQTSAHCSTYRNKKVENFEKKEVMHEPQRSHYLLTNKKMRKDSLLVRVTTRVDMPAESLDGMARCNSKLIFLWCMLTHLVTTIFVSPDFVPNLKLRPTFCSNPCRCFGQLSSKAL